MKTIALVPLDDRPCNLKFPAKLALAAGVNVITPPKELLGYFTSPGNTKEIEKWLLDVAGKADALIISIDMLCYGGLIASRRPDVPEDEVAERLEVFSKIRSITKAPVYIFNILMRLSITADSEASKKLWEDIFEYSRTKDRSALPKKLPKDVLDSYLAARKRDHEINKKAVRLVKEGLADFLIIGKEDCAPGGLHEKEAEALRSDIDSSGLGKKVKLINGADELGMLLTSRAIISPMDKKPVFAVRYSSGRGEGTALYEDVPLSKVVSDHLDALGVKKVEGLEEADTILFVHSFKGAQKDLLLQGSGKDERDSAGQHHLKNFCSEIVMAGEIDKKAAVADVCYCNGADLEFVDYLKNVSGLTKLCAFAGWNTVGNSIGSAIAQAVLPRNRSFLMERFVDDIGYQAVVRQEVNRSLKEQRISPFNLGDKHKEIEKLVASKLQIWMNTFFNQSLVPIPLSLLRLPWPRTFEIDCDIIDA